MLWWFVRRAIFALQVKRYARQNGYALLPRRREWWCATLYRAGFDFELTRGEERLLVKLADRPSRRYTYIFENAGWVTVRHYHLFRGFGRTQFTDRLVDLSALKADRGEQALMVFVGRYIWLGYKEATVEAEYCQGFAPPQTVFHWQIHSARSFLAGERVCL